MKVRLYGAPDVNAHVPLNECSWREVQPEDGWTVGDVLVAAGHLGYNSFALVTPEVEADVAAGELRAISASHDLAGLNHDGRLVYQGAKQILWNEFLSAVRAGLFVGDAERLVVYPYGTAGGPGPEFVQQLVEWFFSGVAVATGGELVKASGSKLKAIPGWRRRRIAKQWRQQDIAGPELIAMLSADRAWDPKRMATMCNLTELEACAMLRRAGYEPGSDGMWRASLSREGHESRWRLEELEKEAKERLGREL
jgi:hypothetical protein